MSRNLLLTVSLAALLAGGSIPASAASLSIGGGSVSSTSVGGTSATVGGGDGSVASATTGGNTVDATIGSSGPLANVTSTGSATDGGSDSDATINLGNLTSPDASGSLVSVDNNGSALNSGSASSAAVDLGGLADTIDLTGLTGDTGLTDLPTLGAGGTTPVGGAPIATGTGTGSLQQIAERLSAGDRALLKLRCRDVLGSPGSYKQNIVAFCQMISQL